MPPSKALNPPLTAKPAKRSRTDGTLSSPHVIDSSDTDDDIPLAAKRRKPVRRAQAPVQTPIQNPDSSDDEPLITRIRLSNFGLSKRTPAIVQNKSDRIDQVVKSSAPGSATPGASLTSLGPLSVDVAPPHETRILAGASSSPSSAVTPASMPLPCLPLRHTTPSLWGEQRNLKSAFESVSKTLKADSSLSATGSTPQAAAGSSGCTEFSPFTQRPALSGPISASTASYMSSASLHASPHRPAGVLSQPGTLDDPFTGSMSSSLRRRVPTPDRLFTNMSLQNVNKLILSMPQVEAIVRKRSTKMANAPTSLKRKVIQESEGAKALGGFKRMVTASKSTKTFFHDIDGENKTEVGEDVLDDEGADSDVDNGSIEEHGLNRVYGSVHFDEAGDDADDEGFGGVDAHAGEVIDPIDDDSSTMAADSEPEETASPSAAKKSRMDNEVAETRQHRREAGPKSSLAARPSEVMKSSQQQPRIDRVACSTQNASFIDLTDDTPLASPPPRRKDAASQPTIEGAPSLATKTPSETPSTSLAAEISGFAQDREAVFFSAFKQRWWLGGWTLRAAVVEINGTLHPTTRKFRQEEGEVHLRALATQGKLAIRHDHVYHLGQDPGPNAVPPPPVKKDGLTDAQRFEQHLKELSNSPMPSLYGNITATRFNLFQNQLRDQIFTEQLFANFKKEETLGKCLAELNRDLSRGRKLSVKEISAAFVYLSKEGKVVLEGEMIRFTEKGMS